MEELVETCCCRSYRQGVTPCLCGCHKSSHETGRKAGLREAMGAVPKYRTEEIEEDTCRDCFQSTRSVVLEAIEKLLAKND